MTLVMTVSSFAALLCTAVLFGTDVFFAVVGRAALARSSDIGIADVMGHIHEVGDARMPFFGVGAILSTLIFSIAADLGTISSTFGLGALVGLFGFLTLYLTTSKPINARLRAEATAGTASAQTRALQTQWDRIVVLRALALSLTMLCLIWAIVLA